MSDETNLKFLHTGDHVDRRHALVVGIDDYAEPALHLPFCVGDALRVGGVLAERGYRVTTLRSGAGPKVRPTLANVTRALTAMMAPAVAGVDDMVVVYFSCHGRMVGGRPVLLMADTPNDDAVLADRGLPLATLLAALRGAPRWVAIFLDVCHMGLGLDPAASQSTDHGAERAGGFALLAGSTSGQITQDTTRAGIFSKVLADGLAGAAAEPDGAVRFGALARHVQAGVATWRKSPEGQKKLSTQTPVLRLEVSDLELLPAHDYVPLAPSLSAKITCASFAPDGRRLATASEDGTVRLWDPRSGAQVLEAMRHASPDGSWGYVGGVVFSPKGTVLASCSNNGLVRTWQAAGANLLTDPAAKLDVMVNKVAWAPDRSQWSAAAGDGVHVYDGDSIARTVGHRLLRGHDGMVWAIAYLPDGALVSGGEDGTVRFWDVAAGTCTAVWKLGNPVWAVAVSPDGKRVATAGADAKPSPSLVNLPRIWNRASGALVRPLRGHEGGVTAIAYSPDGKRLATTGYDGTARVWNPVDGEVERVFTMAVKGKAHRPEAYAACFAPDGTQLFVGYADGQGRLFKLSPPAPAAR